MRILLSLAAVLLASGVAGAAPQTYPSSAGPLAVDTVAGGLAHPWSLAFLPDGRMLVTERPGRMRVVGARGEKSAPLAGVPRVFAHSQAGLMDVILDRGFADNRTIYFSYVEPYRGGGRIAIARAKLDDKTPRLTDVKVIFRQDGPPGDGYNIASRIVQAKNGDLFASQGDHFSQKEMAQSLDNDIGKIIRIRSDGSIPRDNPFVGRTGARPEIWAYGVRNPE